jgi:hypothetical protein
VPAEYPHAGEYGLDDLACGLLKAEAKPPADPLKAARAAITAFCTEAEQAEANWHYTQNRPFTGIGVAPRLRHDNDCSSYVILAYAWAKRVTNRNIPDPSGYNYSGYGNTWDNLDGHPRVGGTYLVGDLAHYDGHVTICKKAGSHLTSRWSSFGREAGPEQRLLYYLDDFRFVCRPPL